MGITVRDRSGSTPGTIQNFSGHLKTSDRAVAGAGSTDAFCGDGPQANRNATVPETVKPLSIPEVGTSEDEPKPQCAVEAGQGGGEVSQANPAVKSFQGNIGPRMAKGSTNTEFDVALDKSPITADPGKSTGGAGVGSHPGLMAAHRHGSISHADHRAMKGNGKAMSKPMNTAESDQGGPLPVVAKVAAETFRNAATDVPATRPVVANLGTSRPMFSREM